MWLAYAPEQGLTWWCPSMRQASERAAELENLFHTERVQRAMAAR
jgi:hypothetical protein